MRGFLRAVAVVFLLSGCGTEDEPNDALLSDCGTGIPCGDIYSEDLLQADATTIEALRGYMLNTSASEGKPLRQESDGRGDIDDLLWGLEVVKQLYGINPIFALALTIHESGWGNSSIARDKRNLWGWKAYDGSAYKDAATFDYYTHGFNHVFNRIKVLYLDPAGRYYKSCNPPEHFSEYVRDGGCTAQHCGASLAGMNCKYASDPGWAEKIRNHMNTITRYINNNFVPSPDTVSCPAGVMWC